MTPSQAARHGKMRFAQGLHTCYYAMCYNYDVQYCVVQCLHKRSYMLAYPFVIISLSVYYKYSATQSIVRAHHSIAAVEFVVEIDTTLRYSIHLRLVATLFLHSFDCT
jgi:hypothetical protein